MTDNQRVRISAWMESLVERNRLSDYSDLHLERIDSAWADRRNWLPAMGRAVQIGVELRSERKWGVVVAAAVSLLAGPDRAGPHWDLATIETALAGQTPSLYLFALGSEPWEESDCVDLGSLLETEFPVGIRTYLCEWYDENDQEFRRSLWLRA